VQLCCALVTNQAAGEGLAAGLATNELSADVLSNKELVLLWVTKFYTQYSMGNIFIRYKFCMISSDMHCQWLTACHQQWEYCISAIKCCSIYFMIMQTYCDYYLRAATSFY